MGKAVKSRGGRRTGLPEVDNRMEVVMRYPFYHGFIRESGWRPHGDFFVYGGFIDRGHSRMHAVLPYPITSVREQRQNQAFSMEENTRSYYLGLLRGCHAALSLGIINASSRVSWSAWWRLLLENGKSRLCLGMRTFGSAGDMPRGRNVLVAAKRLRMHVS